jgi:4-deoxy-L-threo-5-hexosulose-uronate ketol-isomerase
MKRDMEMRNLPDRETTRRMTTTELRQAYLLQELFTPGSVSTVYCDADRAIVGGAVPTTSALKLEATKKEMAAEYFTERREVGIVNIGSPGKVIADGREFPLGQKDMLYVGRGVRTIELASAAPGDPAVYYFVSFPAHAQHPIALIPFEQAERSAIGTAEGASRRTIHKFIHPGGAKSCQLVMGLTELDAGNVWNTMPPHTHQRRMEVYLYYALDPGSVVVHLMGSPDESRSIIIRNRQAVISPSWSIHCGAATQRYSFIWAMGGENQEFSDMDQVSLDTLL